MLTPLMALAPQGGCPGKDALTFVNCNFGTADGELVAMGEGVGALRSPTCGDVTSTDHVPEDDSASESLRAPDSDDERGPRDRTVSDDLVSREASPALSAAPSDDIPVFPPLPTLHARQESGPDGSAVLALAVACIAADRCALLQPLLDATSALLRGDASAAEAFLLNAELLTLDGCVDHSAEARRLADLMASGPDGVTLAAVRVLDGMTGSFHVSAVIGAVESCLQRARIPAACGRRVAQFAVNMLTLGVETPDVRAAACRIAQEHAGGFASLLDLPAAAESALRLLHLSHTLSGGSRAHPSALDFLLRALSSPAVQSLGSAQAPSGPQATNLALEVLRYAVALPVDALDGPLTAPLADLAVRVMELCDADVPALVTVEAGAAALAALAPVAPRVLARHLPRVVAVLLQCLLSASVQEHGLTVITAVASEGAAVDTVLVRCGAVKLVAHLLANAADMGPILLPAALHAACAVAPLRESAHTLVAEGAHHALRALLDVRPSSTLVPAALAVLLALAQYPSLHGYVGAALHPQHALAYVDAANTSVSEVAARLFAAVAGGDTYRMQWAAPDFMVGVLAAVKRCEGREAALLPLLTSLSAAVNRPDVLTTFLNTGGVPVVADAVKLCSFHTGVVTVSVRTLGLACFKNPRCQSVTKDVLGLPFLAGVMHANVHDAAAMEVCCKLVRNLGVNPELQVPLVAAGILDHLYEAMDAHVDVARVQEEAVGALSSLSLSDANKAGIVATHGLDRVYAAMDRHPESAGVQEQGCWTMCNLAFKRPPHQVAIARSDGVRRIYRAMDLFPSMPGLQQSGCKALLNLSHCGEGRARIMSSGGVEVLRRTMLRHPRYMGVQEWGRQALHNLK